MDLLAILVADYASIEAQGKMNVMGIFNEVVCQSFPAALPRVYIVTRLSAGPAEVGRTVKLSIKILDEDGKTELLNYMRDQVVKPPKSSGRRSHIDGVLGVQGIIFRKPGTYQISVLVDNDEKGSHPMYVVGAPFSSSS